MRFGRSGHRCGRFGIIFLVFPGLSVFLSFSAFPSFSRNGSQRFDKGMRVDLGILRMGLAELAMHLVMDLDAM